MPNRMLKQFSQKPLTDEQKVEVTKVRDSFILFAEELDRALPENAEKTTALRKLVEAKDCAIRALIFPEG